MIKISIVIPTHNNPDTLPKTISSIQSQSFQDYEVIIVNDGGQNPSDFLDISDNKFSFINLKENGGVSNARNVGLSEAKGEFIYFLDADDLISEDLLEVAYEHMKASDAGMFVVRHEPVPVEDVTGNEEVLGGSESQGGTIHLTPSEFCSEFAIRTQDFLPSTIIFRRSSIFEAVKTAPWDVSLKNGSDTLLILSVGAQSKVIQYQDKMVVYSVRKNSLSRQNELATWQNRVLAMDIFLNRMKKERGLTKAIVIGRKLRQNAARRVARIHAARGQRKIGLTVLANDMVKHPNLKSGVTMARLGVLGR